MKNPYFYIDTAATSPTLDCVLLSGSRAVVNLTGASVVFKMYDLGGTTLRFQRSASIIDATNGMVRYAWQASDTVTAGSYLGRFVVTFSDLSVQNFPSNRYIHVYVG